MEYYITDEKEENILLYKYYALKEKIEDYKKKAISKQEYKVLKALFPIRYYSNNNMDINKINCEDIEDTDAYPRYYRPTSSLDDQECILQSFYQGNYNVGSIRYFNANNRDIEKFKVKYGDVILFPKELRVKKEDNFYNDEVLFSTNDVIKVPESIIILRHLELGNINYIANNINKLDEQLECFDFSDEIVDSFNINSLENMFGKDKSSIYANTLESTLNKAKQNRKILKLIKR